MSGRLKPHTQHSLASGLFSVVQKHCQSAIFDRARSVSTASQLCAHALWRARLTNLTLQRLLIEQTRGCFTPGFLAIDDSLRHTGKQLHTAHNARQTVRLLRPGWLVSYMPLAISNSDSLS